MSSSVFNRLRGPSIPFCCNGKKPLSRQYSAEPESVRIAALGCLYTIINNQVVPSNGKLPTPVNIVTTPSSTTTDTLRDAVLTEANNPYNPATRFSVFFAPPVPPPQFLQVPPTRGSYEPYAKIVPCVFARVPNTTVAPLIPSSPDPPQLNASGGNQNIMLLWTVPANNGSPILDYEYSLDGIIYLPLNTLKKYSTVEGLINGETYNVSIRAVNAIGASQPSRTIEITPGTVPGAPLLFSALAGNQVISVYWTVPYNGGAAITDYQYTTDGVAYRSLGTANTGTSILFDSNDQPIKNNTQYIVALRALNSYGAGSNTITRRATPTADPAIILLADIAVEEPSGVWTLSYDFEIPPIHDLTIDSGVILIIPVNTTLFNSGTITINGTIVNDGSLVNNSIIYNNLEVNLPLYAIAKEGPKGIWTLIGDYTIAASQTLSIPLRTTLILPAAYTLTNNGTIIIDGRLTTNNNNLINYGTVVQNPPRVINLVDIARLTPPSKWTLRGNTLIDVGFILTIPSATSLIIPLSVTLNIGGDLVIDGTLVIDGELVNNGVITNNISIPQVVELADIARLTSPSTWTLIANTVIDYGFILTIPPATTLIIPLIITPATGRAHPCCCRCRCRCPPPPPPLPMILTILGELVIDGRLVINGELINDGTITNNIGPPQVLNLADIATLTSPFNWTINADALIDVGFILTIPSGTTLTISSGATLTILGELVIDGLLVINGGVVNNGIITNNISTPRVINLADIATLTPPSNWTMTIDTVIDNASVLTIPAATTLTISPGVKLTILGELIIDGWLVINGELVNLGIITNNISIPRVLTLADVATPTSPSNWIMNTDILIDIGFILTIPSGTTLTISSGFTLTILGELIIDGRLVINGRVVNNGTITNNVSTSLVLDLADIATQTSPSNWTIMADALIDPGFILTIPLGTTLTISSGFTLTVLGELVIEGTLVINGNLFNSGIITNI